MNVVRAFRLRVHLREVSDVPVTEPTDDTVDFTIPLSALAAPPVLPGPIVRLAEGRTETQSWTFDVIDELSIITSNLANAGGRMHLLGRIVQVQMQEDGGVWETIGTARLANLSETQGPGLYRITLEDERWKERNTYIFTRSTTTSLWPQGLRYPFRRFPAVATQECLIEAVRADLVLIEPGVEHDPLLPELEALLVEDVIAEPVVSTEPAAGNFRTLRANIDGTDYEIVSFATQYTNTGSPTPGPGVLRVESKVTDAEGRLAPFWVLWPTDQPSPGAAVDVRIYAPEHEPDDALPLHVGVADGSHEYGSSTGLLHPFDAIERAYTEAALRFDPEAFAALQADPRYAKSGWRIRSKRKTAEWAEEAGYQPNLVVPFIDNEGRIAPKPLHLPSAAEVDVDELFVFDVGNTREPHVTWHHGVRDTVNILNVEYEQEQWVPRVPGETDVGERKVPTDRIAITERTLPPIEYDTLHELTPRPLTIRMDGLHRGQGRGIVGFLEDVISPPDRLLKDNAARIASDLFEMFGDGPQTGTIHGMLSTAEVAAGDLVVIDQDSLKNPNPATNARSGQRIVRILQRTFHVDGYEFEYVDVGAKLQPLGEPTITIDQNSDSPETAVDITVADLAADTLATVYVALDEGLEDVRALLVDRDEGTYTVRNLPPGTQIFAAGYAHAPGRVSSSRSSPVSVYTDDEEPVVRELTLTLNGDGTVSAFGRTNATALGSRLYYVAHADDVDPVIDESTYVDVEVVDGVFSAVFEAELLSDDQFTVDAEGWTAFDSDVVDGSPGSVRARDTVDTPQPGELELPPYVTFHQISEVAATSDETVLPVGHLQDGQAGPLNYRLRVTSITAFDDSTGWSDWEEGAIPEQVIARDPKWKKVLWVQVRDDADGLTSNIHDHAWVVDPAFVVIKDDGDLADDVVGSINIVDLAITTAKLDALAVTEAKLAALAVTEAKVAASAITTAKLANDAVTAGKLADDAVGTEHIQALAVTAAEIAASAVTTAKLAADAVTAGHLADNAVGTEHIQALAVTAAEVAANAVTTAKIADAAVDAAKIALAAVTTAKLDDLAVTAAKIAAGEIQAGHIAAGAVTTAKLDALAVTTDKLAAGAVTAAKITAGTITATEIAGSTITAAEMAANSIEAASIAAGAVTTAKLDALAVTTEKIAANAITAAKIAAGTITATEIAANTITASQIAANAIQASELASGAVTTAKLDALAVTAEKIAAGAVTAAKITVDDLAAISADLGEIVSGILNNTASSPTMGLRLNSAHSKPGTWLRYIDFAGTGSDPFIEHEALTLRHDGSAEFSGEVVVGDGILYSPDAAAVRLANAPEGITQFTYVDISTPDGLLLHSTLGIEITGTDVFIEESLIVEDALEVDSISPFSTGSVAITGGGLTVLAGALSVSATSGISGFRVLASATTVAGAPGGFPVAGLEVVVNGTTYLIPLHTP